MAPSFLESLTIHHEYTAFHRICQEHKGQKYRKEFSIAFAGG